MSHVPKLNDYIREYTTSRYNILNKMLEHKNPAFIFMSIIHRMDPIKFYEAIEYVKSYGPLVDIVYLTEGDASDKPYKDGGKIANSTGVDSLKKLVGKSGKGTELNDSEWEEIGRQIAGMEGYNKRDYVGMMNFLNTSCYMHSKIMNHLSNAIRRDIKSKRYQVPKTLKTKGRPKKEKPEEEKPQQQISTSEVVKDGQPNKVQAQAQVQTQPEKINDSRVYTFGDYSRIIENREMVDKISQFTELEDIVKLMAYSLTQLTDLQVSEIDDEIKDYDNDGDLGYETEDGKVFLPYIELYDSYGNPLTEDYSPAKKASIRQTRDNGKGGLKGLVGKNTGDDLEDNDLVSIARRMSGMDDSERGRYMGYVAFLGSSCPIFNYIRKGYLSTLKNTASRFGNRQKRR